MGKYDKPLKKEDLRNAIQNAEREMSVKLAFDGSELAVTPEDLMVQLRDNRNVIIKREDKELTFRVSHRFDTF